MLHPGLIKYGGNKLLNRIYKLVWQRGKVWPWKGLFVEKRKDIFQNSKWKQEYDIELKNRFEILENMEDYNNIDNIRRSKA